MKELEWLFVIFGAVIVIWFVILSHVMLGYRL